MPQSDPERHEQFLTLFTAAEPAIRAYVRRLVPTRQDAADVMQGVALVLWRKFGQLEDVDQFRSWAFGIARYEALAWRRDRARDRMVLSEDVIDVIAEHPELNEQQLAAQRNALEGCLKKIPLENRKLLLAAYSPQAEIRRVAQHSGRTVAGFYQWLHRMRLSLLECTRRALRMEGIQ